MTTASFPRARRGGTNHARGQVTVEFAFLLPVIAAHLGCVVLIRVICRRAGVTPWTTTLVGVLLAMFGSGFENLVFAIQISYYLTLLAFLAQIVLFDHDGPPDWRDGGGGFESVSSAEAILASSVGW